MQRKEYARAASAYELALGLNPLYPEAWFAQGYCYLRLGENTKALQVRLQQVALVELNSTLCRLSLLLCC
jgi:tetratricopeptide (TPR) repeat protein